MQRSSYPSGETTASRVKSLFLHLEKRRGRADADALLSTVKLSFADIENETKSIGVALWYVAVEAFATRYGKEELLATWPSVIDPMNLGVWIRVLRGTSEPGEALRQMDGLGGDEIRTSRWETLSLEPGRWHGRVFLMHDPRIERDGLLTLARQAELRAVPALFGLPPGEVTTVSSHRGTFASRSGAAGQEFVVTWKLPDRRREPLFAAIGGAAVGASGALHSVLSGVLAGAGLASAAFVGTLLWKRDAARKAEATAQSFRIRALERSMQLRDDAQKALAGTNEGSVIAGLYRLGPRLGSGASGVIHKAMRLSDNVPVAIKLLRAAVAHDAIASDRLRREAEAMGLAWHPNVVELYDQGVLPDGTTYLVMEFLEGEPLSARLKRQKLTIDELGGIALQIADALGAVHAAGVIHRDVKPSNVFLARVPAGAPAAEQKARVKLLDFGIARVEWAETRLTNLGAPVGTPGYMSPEQEEGGEIDSRSDLYSFGALLYECLTGIALKPGERPSGVHRASGGVPPPWLDVVEKATAASPRDRFVDAKAMRDAIAGAMRASGADLGEHARRA